MSLNRNEENLSVIITEINSLEPKKYEITPIFIDPELKKSMINEMVIAFPHQECYIYINDDKKPVHFDSQGRNIHYVVNVKSENENKYRCLFKDCQCEFEILDGECIYIDNKSESSIDLL